MLSQRQFMEKVIAQNLDAEMVEFATNFIAKLDKKNATPTKAQVQNEILKNEMVEIFSDGVSRTAKEVAEDMEISLQKASALLKQLVDAERLSKEFDKKGNASYKR